MADAMSEEAPSLHFEISFLAPLQAPIINFTRAASLVKGRVKDG